MLKVKKAHQYLAYMLIVGSQVTVSLGIVRYFAYNDDRKISYVIIGG